MMTKNEILEIYVHIHALKGMLADAINREDWGTVNYIQQRLDALSDDLLKALNNSKKL